MKKILAIMTLAATSACMYAETVIYVVDIAQVHQNYYKTKIVQEQLKSAMESANSELQKMDEQRQKLIGEVQKIEEKAKNPALTESARQEIGEKEYAPKVQEIQALANSMNGIKNQAQQKIMTQQKEVIATHKKEIVAVIAKIAADKKADFIFEKGACYFNKPASDITEEIIAAMNASAPKN